MDGGEWLIILLYIVAIGSVLLLFQFWLVGLMILLVLLIILCTKMATDRKIKGVAEDRKLFVGRVSDGLDRFAIGLEGIKEDVARGFFEIENKLHEERNTTDAKIERMQSDLARKMIDMESSISEVKRWSGKE